MTTSNRNVGGAAWSGVKAVSRGLGLAILVIGATIGALAEAMGRFLVGLLFLVLAIWLVIWVGGWWLEIAREDTAKAVWIAVAVIAVIGWGAKSSRLAAAEAAMKKQAATVQPVTTAVAQVPVVEQAPATTPSVVTSASESPAPPVAEPEVQLDHARCAEFLSRLDAFLPKLRAVPLGSHADRDMPSLLFSSLIAEAEPLRELAIAAGIDRLPEFRDGEFRHRVWQHMTYASQLLSPRRDWMRSIQGAFGDLGWVSVSDYFATLARAVAVQTGLSTQAQAWFHLAPAQELAKRPSFQALLDRFGANERGPEIDRALAVLIDDEASIHAPGYPVRLQPLGAVEVVLNAAYWADKYRAEEDPHAPTRSLMFLDNALARAWDSREATLSPAARR